MNQITNKLKQMKNLSYLLILFLAVADLTDIIVTEFPALTSPLNPNTICSGSIFN